MDTQSRYIEAAVNGVLIASLYLPNGNPQPGPKFDYKLAWFERLIRHGKAREGRRAGRPGRRLQRRTHGAGYLANAISR
jgi:exodeoxyribonuclease-3